MTLQIRIRNKGRDQNQRYSFDSVTTTYPDGGYTSVKEMQKELLRRFPNRENVRNRKIPNGIIRIEGPRCNRKIYAITLFQE